MNVSPPSQLDVNVSPPSQLNVNVSPPSQLDVQPRRSAGADDGSSGGGEAGALASAAARREVAPTGNLFDAARIAAAGVRDGGGARERPHILVHAHTAPLGPGVTAGVTTGARRGAHDVGKAGVGGGGGAGAGGRGVRFGSGGWRVAPGGAGGRLSVP